MSENTWSVYRHTFPDGKVYIGKTKEQPEERWGKYGKNYQGQSKVFNAILAFGWNNTKHEVLFDGLTAEEASRKEYELIRESDKSGGSGNYNVAMAKHEPTCKQTLRGDDAVITKESLRINGKYVSEMSDAFYDRMMKKYGVAPFGLRFEEEQVVFEIWKEADGGYEFYEYGAKYPMDGMTFAEAKKWLAECDDGAEVIKKTFFTKGQIEKAINSLGT